MPDDAEIVFRVSGIEVTLRPDNTVWHDGTCLGSVGREQRLGQWFWRSYAPDSGIAYKRFFTARHEAIMLLLINADLLDGLGF